MADLLQSGTSWLHDQLRQHAASTVVYRRDGAELSIPATLAGNRTEVAEEQEGAVYQVEHRDFLFTAVDLASLHPPARGDLVVFDGRGYEVLPRGSSEDVWRYSDRHHKALRVFAAARTLDTSRLPHPVALEAPTTAPNQYGEQVPGWSVVAELSALVKPQSGSEPVQADQVAALITHRVWIAYRQGVQPDQRFRHDGRALHIVSVTDWRERHELLECVCTERAL